MTTAATELIRIGHSLRVYHLFPDYKCRPPGPSPNAKLSSGGRVLNR
jgi:hypothetical protein